MREETDGLSCLKTCERDSQLRKVSEERMCSLLLMVCPMRGSKDREYTLSCWWLVLLLASDEAKRENVLCHVGSLVLLLATEEAKGGRE